MWQRFILASVSIVLIAIAFVLIDGLIAELTGLSLPGEISAALAFFAAFFVGGRIGGAGYFWFGIVLFLAIRIFSITVIFDTLQEIQAAATSATKVTWVGVAVDSWQSFALSFFAVVAGLVFGARSATTGTRNPHSAA